MMTQNKRLLSDLLIHVLNAEKDEKKKGEKSI